jgi:hypothetical protein
MLQPQSELAHESGKHRNRTNGQLNLRLTYFFGVFTKASETNASTFDSKQPPTFFWKVKVFDL